MTDKLPQNNDDWSTPDWLFKWANNRYGPFTSDAAASESNHKCAHWRDCNGVWHGEQPKSGAIWCNPPFSNIEPFVDEALSFLQYRTTVLLVPANRTETKWWGKITEAVAHEDERASIIYLRPRIRYVDPFGAGRNAPKFASCLIVCDHDNRLYCPVWQVDLTKEATYD